MNLLHIHIKLVENYIFYYGAIFDRYRTIPRTSQCDKFHMIYPVLEEREVLQLKRQKLEYEELAPLTESVVENVDRLLKVGT